MDQPKLKNVYNKNSKFINLKYNFYVLAYTNTIVQNLTNSVNTVQNSRINLLFLS